MIKHENYLRTLHTKDRGWFWFGLTVVIQIVLISVSYLMMNISL
ncbi:MULTISPECIES: KGW motif small protein [Acinetobacter]|nr:MULTISPECIES: KGW motif small protein [Acinetobacter]